jgi:hypothetical protein
VLTALPDWNWRYDEKMLEEIVHPSADDFSEKT